MKRKAFIRNLTGTLLLGLPVLSVLACSGSDDLGDGEGGNDLASDCIANGTTFSIFRNHGHIINVSKQDIADGLEKIYEIPGTSPHSHQVRVTESNFRSLRNNQQIQIESSTVESHFHTVTIRCS